MIALVLAACQPDTATPTYSGFAIQNIVSGEHLSPVAVRGDTAFSCLTNGSVQASLISNGRVIWTNSLGPRIGRWYIVSTALTNDLFVVGINGAVIAVRRSDGSLAWNFDEQTSEVTAEYGIASDSNYVAFSERRGQAIVLDARTGSVVWRRRLFADDAYAFIRAPLIANGTLTYLRVGSTALPLEGDTLVFAMEVATGAPKWTINASGARDTRTWPNDDALLTSAGLVFTLINGRVIAADHSTGVIRWITEPSTPSGETGGTYRHVAVTGSDLLASSTNSPGVQSIRLADGTINWTVDSPIGSPVSALAVNETTIAVTAAGGQLILIDRSTRNVRFIARDAIQVKGVNVFFYPSPAFSGKTLIAPTSEGLITFAPTGR